MLAADAARAARAVPPAGAVLRHSNRLVLRGFAALSGLEQFFYGQIEERGIRMRQVMPPVPRDGASWVMFSIFFGKQGM